MEREKIKATAAHTSAVLLFLGLTSAEKKKKKKKKSRKIIPLFFWLAADAVARPHERTHNSSLKRNNFLFRLPTTCRWSRFKKILTHSSSRRRRRRRRRTHARALLFFFFSRSTYYVLAQYLLYVYGVYIYKLIDHDCVVFQKILYIHSASYRQSVDARVFGLLGCRTSRAWLSLSIPRGIFSSSVVAEVTNK